MSSLTAMAWLVAQQAPPAQVPVFRSAIDLVQVQAVVTDAHGDPVAHLTQSDFRLFDSGRPQPIATFAEVTHTPSATHEFPPLLALDVADNTNAATAGRLVVLLLDDLHVQAPRPVVADILRRIVSLIAPPVSIALVSTSGQVAVEPTEDAATIFRALAAYANPPRPDAIKPQPMSALGKLLNVSTALAPDNLQRKTCIVVSSGEPTADDVVTQSGRGGAIPALMALQRGNLTTYVLDPSVETGMRPPLATLAEATGGFAAGGTWLEAGIARLVEDINHYYLLGFYPEGKPDDKTHALEVRVTRPGVDVYARRSYVDGAPIKAEKGATPLQDLAWNPLPVTDLPLQLFAALYFAPDGRPELATVIQAPTGATAEGAFSDHVQFGLMAIKAGDKKAMLKVEHHADVSLPVAIGSETRVPARYELLTTLALPPGRYQLRASAISATLGKGGSVYISTELPDPRAADLTLGGVILGVDGQAKTPIADQTSLTDLSLPFAPVLERTFSADETLRAYFQVARRSPATPVAGTIGILNAADRLVFDSSWQIGSAATPQVDVRVPLAGLAPGPYRLIVTVSDVLPSSRTQRQVGFIVKETGGP